MSLIRLFVAALILVGGILVMRSLKASPVPADHRALREFPDRIGGLYSRDLPIDPDVATVIGADDYINREYRGSEQPIELYFGYYKDQRSGDAIHSPKNCLPGQGWEPVRSALVQIGSPGHPALVNEYIVEQGQERDLVLYWYQTHRRTIASEYWAKFWLVDDAVHERSTDGALIRIWTTAEDGEAKAKGRGIDFARRVYPQISGFLPN